MRGIIRHDDQSFLYHKIQDTALLGIPTSAYIYSETKPKTSQQNNQHWTAPWTMRMITPVLPNPLMVSKSLVLYSVLSSTMRNTVVPRPRLTMIQINLRRKPPCKHLSDFSNRCSSVTNSKSTWPPRMTHLGGSVAGAIVISSNGTPQRHSCMSRKQEITI